MNPEMKAAIEAAPQLPGLHMIMPGVDPAGGDVFWMPPNPVADPRAITMVRNWVKYPELWDVRQRVNINGIVPDGVELIRRNWESNMSLENGKPKDWKQLWGKETGKICLLVSSGPSLKESLPTIRKLARNRDKYFTLGLNRSLTAHDLDYYNISDRRGDRDWTEDGRDYSKTTLIASPTVACQHPPRFKKRYWGEHFFSGLPETGLTRLATEMCITMCDTMHAAYKLGAKEIWLYGCDFALSGSLESDRNSGDTVCLLKQYYHDVDARTGMAIREGICPTKPPVVGINGRIVFPTWELMAYAAYTTVMAYMIENDGGVPVYNHTPCGILNEVWHNGGVANGSDNDIPDVVSVCAEKAGESD